MIQKMKIAPHVFVGLGGAGSKIVNEIARKLKRRGTEYERYKELVHFFAFDTDQHELKQADRVDVRVPISDFDKRAFVAHAFGQRSAPEDPLLSSWWPEYYMPRDVAGAGAGQIRIESRLSLYFTLKHKPEIATALERAVGQSFGLDNRFRDVDKPPMIHVYASFAGGTGSGSFLPIALFVADLFGAHRRPIVVGSFVLPSVFRRAGLPMQQLDKIMANGYAGLTELEHMQNASSEAPIEFQYDPRAKELQKVTRRPFDQVYLIDDIGAQRETISDPRQIYQSIADGAYTQIFSDILGRQASTADNDEREMGVSDAQRYTKRYGSFGLSVLTVPDTDILEYCAYRFAVEALGRVFALPDDAGDPKDRAAADRDKRDQDFVRALVRQSHAPGEAGDFYRRILSRCDGSEGEQGAVDRFLRLFDTDFDARFARHLAALPRWTEDRLLEFDEDPEAVRSELPRRLEAWLSFVAKAREAIDAEAEQIASECAGSAHEHAFAKLAGQQGPIFERLFLVRLGAQLRETQARARVAESEARQRLASLRDSYQSWTERLAEAAPKTLTEYLRGNDYGREVVPEFMAYYRSAMEAPQIALLKAGGVVDLCDDLLREIERRKDGLGTLFGELVSIRGRAQAVCAELLEFGVRREAGGAANEHVLDVEVFQNHEDPSHFRMWHWVFDRREDAGDYDPTRIFPAIQEAHGRVKHARHMADAVLEGLVAMGRERWRERIVGRDDPSTTDEMGVELSRGLEEEARLALGWAKLRKRHPEGPRHRLGDWKDDWEEVDESLRPADIAGYISQKIQHAARRCAPFLRLMREEGATNIEPKRYAVIHPSYLDDAGLRGAVLDNERFPIKPGDVLRSDDPKKIVFYWSELGMTLYRIESLDEYFDRYHHIKRDELARGKTYRWSDLPYQPRAAQRHAEHCEGRKVPDIPLHIDRRWEGAPDEFESLADVAPKAVHAGHGRLAWLERRRDVADQRAGEELVQFVFAQCFDLVVEDASTGVLSFKNDHILERDRTLDRFRDRAFERFQQAKLPIRDWLLEVIDAKSKALVEARDRAGAKALIETHRARLGRMRMQLEGREQAFVEQELAATQQALDVLLAKM